MIFSKAFFVLSFAAFALAVPAAPPQNADAGTGNVVGAAVNAALEDINVNVLSNDNTNNNN